MDTFSRRKAACFWHFLLFHITGARGIPFRLWTYRGHTVLADLIVRVAGRARYHLEEEAAAAAETELGRRVSSDPRPKKRQGSQEISKNIKIYPGIQMTRN